MPKPIQIFKPGRHTAMSGAVLSFSAADLAATAAAYDPARHEAPIVVGHPITDGPAYGWVGALSFADGALDATPVQVNPEFAELVHAGAFKKISASFYAPDAPANPVPGVYYLRHVGFLGAQAPAVKGLRAPSFAADEAGVIEFGEQDAATDPVPGSSPGQAIPAQAPPVIPAQAGTQSLIQETLVTPEEKAALEAANAALEAKNTALAAEVAEFAARERASVAAARHAAHVAFAEQLAAGGKLLPAQAAVAVATLDFVAAQEAAVEFGEGDARKPLADAIKEFLQALPRQVDFGESVTRDRAAAALGAVDFAAPAGLGVDGERLALHHKALAWQGAHPDADYVAAVRAVSH